MPHKYTHYFTDTDIMESVRAAMISCLAAGLCPSKSNLRLHGACGGQNRFNAARDQLIASGEIAVPAEILAKIKSGAIGDNTPAPGHVTWRERRKAKTECLPKPLGSAMPKQPRYDSPVWDDIVAGEKAWKRCVDWKRLWRRRKEGVSL